MPARLTLDSGSAFIGETPGSEVMRRGVSSGPHHMGRAIAGTPCSTDSSTFVARLRGLHRSRLTAAGYLYGHSSFSSSSAGGEPTPSAADSLRDHRDGQHRRLGSGGSAISSGESFENLSRFERPSIHIHGHIQARPLSDDLSSGGSSAFFGADQLSSDGNGLPTVDVTQLPSHPSLPAEHFPPLPLDLSDAPAPSGAGSNSWSKLQRESNMVSSRYLSPSTIDATGEVLVEEAMTDNIRAEPTGGSEAASAADKRPLMPRRGGAVGGRKRWESLHAEIEASEGVRGHSGSPSFVSAERQNYRAEGAGTVRSDAHLEETSLSFGPLPRDGSSDRGNAGSPTRIWRRFLPSSELTSPAMHFTAEASAGGDHFASPCLWRLEAASSPGADEPFLELSPTSLTVTIPEDKSVHFVRAPAASSSSLSIQENRLVSPSGHLLLPAASSRTHPGESDDSTSSRWHATEPVFSRCAAIEGEETEVFVQWALLSPGSEILDSGHERYFPADASTIVPNITTTSSQTIRPLRSGDVSGSWASNMSSDFVASLAEEMQMGIAENRKAVGPAAAAANLVSNVIQGPTLSQLDGQRNMRQILPVSLTQYDVTAFELSPSEDDDLAIGTGVTQPIGAVFASSGPEPVQESPTSCADCCEPSLMSNSGQQFGTFPVRGIATENNVVADARLLIEAAHDTGRVVPPPSVPEPVGGSASSSALRYRHKGSSAWPPLGPKQAVSNPRPYWGAARHVGVETHGGSGSTTAARGRPPVRQILFSC